MSLNWEINPDLLDPDPTFLSTTVSIFWWNGHSFSNGLWVKNFFNVSLNIHLDKPQNILSGGVTSSIN